LTFRSEGHVDRWCEEKRIPKGAVMPIGQCALLGRLWYADRLLPTWRPKDAATIERIVSAAGIHDDFWSVR